MTRYKIYYWLYSFLNKTFGRDLTFKRDRLHAIYVVNRHSFVIYGNNTKMTNVYDFLWGKLSANNAVTEKEDYGFTVNIKKNKKSFHIVVRKVEKSLDYNQEEGVSIFIF